MYPLIISQYKNENVIGRYTVEITAVKESDDWLYGNQHTKEVHVFTYGWRQKMKPQYNSTSSIKELRGINAVHFV